MHSSTAGQLSLKDIRSSSRQTPARCHLLHNRTDTSTAAQGTHAPSHLSGCTRPVTPIPAFLTRTAPVPGLSSAALLFVRRQSGAHQRRSAEALPEARHSAAALQPSWEAVRHPARARRRYPRGCGTPPGRLCPSRLHEAAKTQRSPQHKAPPCTVSFQARYLNAHAAPCPGQRSPRSPHAVPQSAAVRRSCTPGAAASSPHDLPPRGPAALPPLLTEPRGALREDRRHLPTAAGPPPALPHSPDSSSEPVPSLRTAGTCGRNERRGQRGARTGPSRRNANHAIFAGRPRAGAVPRRAPASRRRRPLEHRGGRGRHGGAARLGAVWLQGEGPAGASRAPCRQPCVRGDNGPTSQHHSRLHRHVPGVIAWEKASAASQAMRHTSVLINYRCQARRQCSWDALFHVSCEFLATIASISKSLLKATHSVLVRSTIAKSGRCSWQLKSRIFCPQTKQLFVVVIH